MPVIDADTHVDECEETWSYMPLADSKHRPVTLVPGDDVPEGSARPGYTRHWFVGGTLSIRRIRDDMRTGTTVETRELRDVTARLRHMDKMGVDVHILYPTAFLTHITGDADAQVAICKSYNRWLSEKCSQSDGRLRWVAVVPMLDVEAAVDEMHWASEHGACGVFKLATEVGKRVTDPYFFPIYQAANDLGLGLCIHTGSGDQPRGGSAFGDALGNTNVVDAFHGIAFSGLAGKFPKMRFGFIEAGASWIPYVIDQLYARRERMSWAWSSFNYADLTSLFQDNRLYVTCQSHEDISYLLRFGTEDNLMIGTDYTHADASAEIEAIAGIRRMADEGIIDQTAKRKILEDNPKAFYGL
jgi:predicted TIM-barrel fold metal-dependent hydrolase